MEKKLNASDNNLTGNQRHVLELLVKKKTALGAYDILECLRSQGFRAPLQVYRALDTLIKKKLVHRLESMNAFIACSHPKSDKHLPVAFAICNKCRSIIEFDNNLTVENIEHQVKEFNFHTEKITLEIRGICAVCQTSS